MVTLDRLSSLQQILKETRDIDGDFMETGVWRGGASILARLALDVLHADEEETRKVWVCDSFEGLPPPTMNGDEGSKAWDPDHGGAFLAVSLEDVQKNFEFYGVDINDTNRVEFVKGFFNESMPLVFDETLHVKALSVLRMDGDMYESTMDVLFNVFHKVSVGGVIIVDDWGMPASGWRARAAVKDFFKWHDVPMPTIHEDGGPTVHFVKEDKWEGVHIKREKYEEAVASKGQ